jgi:carboxyl-terminal processing protease
MGDGIGYIRLTQFQQDSHQEVNRALQEFTKEKGGLKGLILDLRNNPGGLLDQAVRIADEFIESGLVVYTDGRVEAQKTKYAAHKEGTYTGFPIVVLVNAGSASASEIVAGALQDHGRAIIIGQRTFGKASVQTILPLEDGSALRLTTARYYTPSGRSIQAKGIDPDIVVSDGKEPPDGHVKILRERDIERHLKGDGEEAPAVAPVPQEGKKEDRNGVKKESPLEPEVRKEDAKDPQLDRAVELLKGWEIFKSRFIDRKKAS